MFFCAPLPLKRSLQDPLGGGQNDTRNLQSQKRSGSESVINGCEHGDELIHHSFASVADQNNSSLAGSTPERLNITTGLVKCKSLSDTVPSDSSIISSEYISVREVEFSQGLEELMSVLPDADAESTILCSSRTQLPSPKPKLSLRLTPTEDLSESDCKNKDRMPSETCNDWGCLKIQSTMDERWSYSVLEEGSSTPTKLEKVQCKLQRYISVE